MDTPLDPKFQAYLNNIQAKTGKTPDTGTQWPSMPCSNPRFRSRTERRRRTAIMAQSITNITDQTSFPGENTA